MSWSSSQVISAQKMPHTAPCRTASAADLDALANCLRGNFDYTASATLLWREPTVARGPLASLVGREGEVYDLADLVLDVLAEDGMSATAT